MELKTSPEVFVGKEGLFIKARPGMTQKKVTIRGKKKTYQAMRWVKEGKKEPPKRGEGLVPVKDIIPGVMADAEKQRAVRKNAKEELRSHQEIRTAIAAAKDPKKAAEAYLKQRLGGKKPKDALTAAVGAAATQAVTKRARGEGGKKPERSPGGFVEKAITRLRSGDKRGVSSEFHQGMTTKDREAFDEWLVEMKHPLAYEAGTTESRFSTYVQERIRGMKKSNVSSILAELLEKAKRVWVPPSSKRKGYYRQDPRGKKEEKRAEVRKALVSYIKDKVKSSGFAASSREGTGLRREMEMAALRASQMDFDATESKRIVDMGYDDYMAEKAGTAEGRKVAKGPVHTVATLRGEEYKVLPAKGGGYELHFGGKVSPAYATIAVAEGAAHRHSAKGGDFPKPLEHQKPAATAGDMVDSVPYSALRHIVDPVGTLTQRWSYRGIPPEKVPRKAIEAAISNKQDITLRRVGGTIEVVTGGKPTPGLRIAGGTVIASIDVTERTAPAKEIVQPMPEGQRKQHGFDLTKFNPGGFQKVLAAAGLKGEGRWIVSDAEMTGDPTEDKRKKANLEEGKYTDYGKFVWEGEGIRLVTANNPITGQYGTAGGARNIEKDYASYIGIEGSPEKVKAVATAIKENAAYKDESRGQRDFI